MPDKASGHDSIADPGRVGTRLQFAREFTLLRERAGLTVRDVARAIGVPGSTVGGYFAGRYLPPVRPSDLLQKMLVSCGVTDASDMQAWLEALSRVRRAPGRRPADAPVPYRGLASFQPEDTDWFYGRQQLTSTLVEQLRHRYVQGGLLVVVGPSGSGKSSLLRAGLIPALHSGELGIPGSSTWPYTLLTPGAQPVRELAAHLAVLTDANPDRLATALLSQPARCGDLARQAARLEENGATAYCGGADEAQSRLVVVVDQFEEVFTACPDEPERQAFIAALCAAASGDGDNAADALRKGHADSAPAALIVLGLRADFYPHALRYPALMVALQNRQVLVGPMTEDELRSAIVEPARKAKLDIEDGLVEVLLRDLAPATGQSGSVAAHDAGTLPLLSHALLTTWERSRRGNLTVADYRESGGIQGAVARTAEQVYSELTPTQRDLARQIFIRLVHVADDTADTRRRVPRNELMLRDSDALLVLDVFIEKRLITANTDDVEIAHEALLLAWPRLRGWIDNNRTGVRIHRQLTFAAELWRDSGRDPSALYGGGRLTTAEDWANEPAHADDLNRLEREFLDTSVEHRRAEEKSARRRTHSLQRLVAALAALSLIVGFLAVFAYQQKVAVTRQRDLAISRQVASYANQLRSTDVALAMQLSLAAYRISPSTEAWSSLLGLTASPAATRMLGPIGTEMHSVALNPRKTILAAGSGDRSVRLWDMRRPGRPIAIGAPLMVASGAVTSVAFAPDGRVLAAACAGSSVWLWNVDDPRRPTMLDRLTLQPAAVVNSIAFSSDGRTLAAASADGMVYLWNTSDTHHISPFAAPLTANLGEVNTVAFQPGATVLAAGGSNGHIGLWQVSSAGQPIRTDVLSTGSGEAVNSVTFSPDGRTVAAGSSDNKVWLWNVADAQRSKLVRPPLTGPASWVYSVAFSPDGRTMAAGSADNSVYIWNWSNGTLLAKLPHPAPVLSVTYGRDSRMLATGDADGIARLWTVPGPILTGAQGSIFTVAFSPDSRNLAVASGDGAIRIWDVAGSSEPALRGQPLTAAGIIDGTVAYGPGGRLAAGGANGTVQLWNVQDASHPVRLRAPPTALNTAIQYVAFNRSGHLLAAGSTAGSIELWNTSDLARTEPVAVVPASGTGPGRDTFAVVFSPDGRLMATAGDDGTVRLWNVANPRHPRQVGSPLTRLTSAVYQVAFSPGGRLLAAAGEDGKVRLWNVADPGSPHLVSMLSGPIGIIYDVSFSPDGRILATANGDKTVALWNISRPGEPHKLGLFTGFSGTVFSVAFSPSGNAVAAGSQDNTARLWLANPDSAADYVCSISGDAITPAEWAQYIPGLPYNPPCTR